MFGMGYGAMVMMWPMMVFGIAVPVVVLIVLAGVVFLAVRAGRGGSGRLLAWPAETRSAKRILHDRYARGEIDGDEYQQRRDALR